MTKNVEDKKEAVVVLDIPQAQINDTVDNDVYSRHMVEWDESDAHKLYIAENTVGLKTGHNGKARYYVTRAPRAVVKNAHCNQYVPTTGPHADNGLIVAIFTVKLESPSKDRIRKLYTIGYGPVVSDSRECYTLTGGLRRVKDNAFVLSEQDDFHALIEQASENAAIEGITEERFSNVLGRVTRVKTESQLQAESDNAAHSVTRATSW